MRILETASYVPARVVTNDELSQLMDTSDEWITTRTGIKQRHISQGETTSDLAVNVANQLLAKAGLAAEQVALIVVATMSPDSYTPSTAAIVQGQIGATKAVAFDLSAACSGFVYALHTVERLLNPGQRALVIGSEVLSKLIDWQDRTTAVLFGDGAGGVLVEQETTGPSHVLGEHLATFGDQADQLSAGQTTPLTSFTGPVTKVAPFTMNGRAVYRFATHEVPTSIRLAAQQAGVTIGDIDAFLLHQANARIIDQVAKRLQLDRQRFPVNISEYGNTSAASEPILFAEEVQKGHLRRGDLVALSGFGGGLTVGTLILRY